MNRSGCLTWNRSAKSTGAAVADNCLSMVWRKLRIVGLGLNSLSVSRTVIGIDLPDAA